MFLKIKTAVIITIDCSNLAHIFQMSLYFFCVFDPSATDEYDFRKCNLSFLRNHYPLQDWFRYFFWIIFGIKIVGSDLYYYVIWVLVSYVLLYIIFHTSNICTWESSNIGAILVVYFWWHLPSFGKFYHAVTNVATIIQTNFIFICCCIFIDFIITEVTTFLRKISLYLYPNKRFYRVHYDLLSNLILWWYIGRAVQIFLWQINFIDAREQITVVTLNLYPI